MNGLKDILSISKELLYTITHNIGSNAPLKQVAIKKGRNPTCQTGAENIDLGILCLLMG